MTITVIYHADLFRDSMVGRRVTSREWSALCKSFMVDEVIVIDPEGKYELDGDIRKMDSLDDAVFAFPQAWVLVEHLPGSGESTLAKFTHPTGDVVYCFGSDSKGLLIPGAAPPGSWVTIDTPDPQGLYSDQAAAIVLYDRSQRLA